MKKLDLLNQMESTRIALVLTSLGILQIYGENSEHSKHAEQAQGAADMLQDWIEGLREEV
jgi:hypothetical protein